MNLKLDFLFIFPWIYLELVLFQILAISCNLIRRVLGRLLFSIYLSPSSNRWKFLCSVHTVTFSCISRLWHLFGLDHCKSRCVQSHLGESEGQDRFITSHSPGLFSVHEGEVTEGRMWWKKCYNTREGDGCAWRSFHCCFYSVLFFFILFFSESNFSAFADCQLSCLKDFHVSSFNSRSFDTDFFILLSLSSLMMLSWELLSLSSEGWECLDLDCFSPGTAFGFQFNNNNKSICELHWLLSCLCHLLCVPPKIPEE